MSRQKAIEKTVFCRTCGKEVRFDEFRDEMSIKEYFISQMCQECQDMIFGGE